MQEFLWNILRKGLDGTLIVLTRSDSEVLQDILEFTLPDAAVSLDDEAFSTMGFCIPKVELAKRRLAEARVMIPDIS